MDPSHPQESYPVHFQMHTDFENYLNEAAYPLGRGIASLLGEAVHRMPLVPMDPALWQGIIGSRHTTAFTLYVSAEQMRNLQTLYNLTGWATENILAMAAYCLVEGVGPALPPDVIPLHRPVPKALRKPPPRSS